jgi:hypothetical protein
MMAQNESRHDDDEGLEDVFPELDDAARRRAEARMSAGVEAHAALAQESVMLHMVRAYN